MTELLYYAGWTGAIVATVILAIMAFAVWLVLRAKPSPHADIPSRVQMLALWSIILDRPDLRQLTVPRHHRGAIYWHSINAGFSVKDALELALTPEASEVEYRIVEV